MTTPAELARLRQGLYRFFAASFGPPAPPLFEQLSAAVEYIDGLDLTGYAFSREWCALVGVLGTDAEVDDLAPEHVRLFASGTSGVLCPPIESFYRVAGRHEAIADIVAAIQNDYRKIGVASLASDAPDHVSTQLEIMSVLCGHESSAWETGRETESSRLLDTEARFLRRHLAAWVPQLRTRTQAVSPLPFYSALVDAVHAFVVHDGDLVFGLRQWTGIST